MIIILFLVFCFPSDGHAWPTKETKSFVEIARNVDWSCMKVQTTPCPKPVAPYVGVHWRYWEPVLVMETVKAPGDYVIQEIGPIVGPMAKKVQGFLMQRATGLKNVEHGGGNGSGAMGGSNLQFNEVHLYDFPLKIFMNAVMCPSIPNVTLGVRYLSEADAPRWRMPNNEATMFHVGNWGPLSPRTGFLFHHDPKVASAVHALRGVSIASGLPSSHVVESRLDFFMDLVRDKMQMIYPSKGACMMPGTDVRLWPQNAETGEKKYVWVYWRYRECCK